MLESLFSNSEIWKYVSIPFVAGFVGWMTNWVAIKMTFLPLEFLGLKPPYLGWQGIIPSKAEKMATTFVDSTMSRLGTLPELFEEMEPRKIAAQIVKVITPRLDAYTDEIMLRKNPTLWRSLPALAKSQVYDGVRDGLPRLVDNLMLEIRDNVEEVLDFKHMIVNRLVKDKALLNRLFLECGADEFRFIVNSGSYFGFLFGLIQLTVWIFYQGVWVLPVFGLLVGWATNWIALNIIFRPLHPKKIGPWTLQGLFLKRQKEVARVWCGIVTREMITIRQMIRSMLNGPRADRTHELIRQHMEPLVDDAVGLAQPAARVMMGADGLAAIRSAVGKKAVDVSLEPFNDWRFNTDRARIVERLLRERMASMPPEEFQNLLRPCFQEDEFKLILVGAVLGFLAGLGQLLFVFGIPG